MQQKELAKESFNILAKQTRINIFISSIIKMSLGSRIKALRTRMGLNKSDLAKVLDISHVQVIRYERDESIPPAKKLGQIADYFGVTIDYLLENERKRKTRRLDISKRQLSKLMDLPDEAREKVIDYINLLHSKYFGS